MRERFTAQEQQQFVKQIASKFQQNLGQLLAKKHPFGARLQDFPLEHRESIGRFRANYGKTEFFGWSDKHIEWNDLLPILDEDEQRLTAPKVDALKAFRSNWKSALDYLAQFELAWDKLTTNYNDSFQTVSSDFKAGMIAFRNTLDILSKRALTQFSAGLENNLPNHPNRHLYIRFWMNGFIDRFKNRNPQRGFIDGYLLS